MHASSDIRFPKMRHTEPVKCIVRRHSNRTFNVMLPFRSQTTPMNKRPIKYLQRVDFPVAVSRFVVDPTPFRYGTAQPEHVTHPRLVFHLRYVVRNPSYPSFCLWLCSFIIIQLGFVAAIVLYGGDENVMSTEPINGNTSKQSAL